MVCFLIAGSLLSAGDRGANEWLYGGYRCRARRERPGSPWFANQREGDKPAGRSEAGESDSEEPSGGERGLYPQDRPFYRAGRAGGDSQSQQGGLVYLDPCQFRQAGQHCPGRGDLYLRFGTDGREPGGGYARKLRHPAGG